MPWQEDKEQRTERATPRRRQEAREKGQVARSAEVGSTIILTSGLAVFYFFGMGMFQSLKDVMAKAISIVGSTVLTEETIVPIFKNTIMDVSYILLPILILPAAGLAANVMQVGLLFTLKPLAPNLSKINPLAGFKRIVSERMLAELIKGIFKMIVVGYISYLVIKAEFIRFAPLIDMSISGIIFYLSSTAAKIFILSLVVLIIIAVLDYAFNRWEMEKGLRMTKEEVKEEIKETEGNPLLKSRIRSLQREMARKRMMQEVPKATVVVTNPTHLAVAIRYEHGKMRAPLVVAKGAGIIAEKIREIAREHNVPIVENKPLAQLIWKAVEIGREIPASLYKAVAEILAYVYRLKAGKEMRSEK